MWNGIHHRNHPYCFVRHLSFRRHINNLISALSPVARILWLAFGILQHFHTLSNETRPDQTTVDVPSRLPTRFSHTSRPLRTILSTEQNFFRCVTFALLFSTARRSSALQSRNFPEQGLPTTNHHTLLVQQADWTFPPTACDTPFTYLLSLSPSLRGCH